MKKLINSILLISLLVISGCGNKHNVPSIKSSSVSYVEDDSSMEDESESSSQSSNKPSSSSSSSSSSQPDYKDNQLSTESGLYVNFSAQGARVTSIKYGKSESSAKQIAKDGFVVGRVANRIKEGKFTLNGVSYQLTKNNNGNHLHGGGSSWQGPFATKNWTKVEQTKSTITYKIHSNDGEEGYPGNFDMTVKYTLSEEGELLIEYSGKSDKDTLWNPTNHLYLSLNASNSSNSNTNLWINADEYTELDSGQIPTGEILSVTGTQFDYSEEKKFDSSKNYDDNYVLKGEGYRKVATMKGNTTGVKVDVFTDRPGLQLYKPDNGFICLETQMFPDMINHSEFDAYGSIVIRANQEYTTKTAYVFTLPE